VKHDDRTHPVYGGNKVRKIGRLLEHAKSRGAETVVTLGAVGSHHVLTTGVFGKLAGIRVEAVLVGQPGTPHVLENLRADLAQGVRVFAASSYAYAGVLLAARRARGAFYIPAGGSNPIGTMGYVDAAIELAEQVRRGDVPEPDVIVVPMGSGGTSAGLLVGLASTELRTRVLAVTVTEPAWYLEHRVRALARACSAPSRRASVLDRLEHTRAYLGAGYGHPTPEGERATVAAASVGLELDPTYTAKAFAAALDRVALGREQTVLYWHTLSSAPMSPLLVGAPEARELDPKLRRLAH
jgi:D-cysteine desulfhydrase